MLTPWWWWKAQPSDLCLGSPTTMIVIGIVLSFVGLGFLCWLLLALAVQALPFFVLCGRPHKTNYVASHDMWRRGRSMLFLSKTFERCATYR